MSTKLASHNSWTYLKPVWYMRPFQWLGKCQNIDSKEQYWAGVRMFDLRVDFRGDGTPYIRHGLMSYSRKPKSFIYNELRWLNEMSNFTDSIYVRVVLEDRKIYDPGLVIKFMDFCECIERDFPQLKFFGGNSRHRWDMKYHQFEGTDPYYLEVHGSVRSERTYEKLIPWFYAKKHNQDTLTWKVVGFVMIDFIKKKEE